MPKKYMVFLKAIGRKWFLILVVIIIIIATIDLQIALILTGISLGLFLLSYFPALFFKSRLKRFLKKNDKIVDVDVAKGLDKPLSKIRKKMFELSQDQEGEKWVIVFLDNRYTFYNEDVLDKFREFYNKGYGEKELLEELHGFGVKTKAEVKSIKDTLIKLDRLEEREVSVKERRRQKKFYE